MKTKYQISVVLLLPLLLFSIGASPRSSECRINSTRAMIAAIRTACDVFQLDTGQYPTEQKGLAALLTDPGVTNWNGPYIRSKYAIGTTGVNLRLSFNKSIAKLVTPRVRW